MSAGQELILRDGKALVDRETGELLNVKDAGDETLAQYLDAVRAFEDQLRTAKRKVGDELLQRMDADATWTINIGGYKIKGRSTAPVTGYDTEKLERALGRLVKAGTISQAAADRALSIEVVKVRKVNKTGINALLKLGGKVAAAVKRCGTEEEVGQRPVPSVTRAES